MMLQTQSVIDYGPAIAACQAQIVGAVQQSAPLLMWVAGVVAAPLLVFGLLRAFTGGK